MWLFPPFYRIDVIHVAPNVRRAQNPNAGGASTRIHHFTGKEYFGDEVLQWWLT